MPPPPDSSREPTHIVQQNVIGQLPISQTARANQFPSDNDITRLNNGELYEKIYEGKFYDIAKGKGAFRLKHYFESDPAKREVLTVSYNVVATLIEKTTRFFIGGDMGFEAETENEQQKEKLDNELEKIVEDNDFAQVLAEASIAFQAHGYCTMAVFGKENAFRETEALIQELSYYNSFPVFTFRGRVPEEHIIADYIRFKAPGDTMERIYIYKQRYFVEGAALKIEHSLWRADKWVAVEKVNIGILGAEFKTFEKNPVQTVEGLKSIPIVQINELKLGHKSFGNSRVQRIKSLVEELNDSLTRVAVQFVKHVAAKIAAPRSSVSHIIKHDPNTGQETIDAADLELFLIDNGDQIPQYITNENPLIEQAFTHIEKLLVYICAAMECPMQFLGLDKQSLGNVKKHTMQMMMMDFLKKIEDYQRAFQILSEKSLKAALLIRGNTLPEDFRVRVKFREGLPRDLLEEVDTYGGALNRGIMSKRKAVSKFQRIQGEELEEELGEIKKEEEIKFSDFSQTQE